MAITDSTDFVTSSWSCSKNSICLKELQRQTSQQIIIDSLHAKFDDCSLCEKVLSISVELVTKNQRSIGANG